MICAFYLGDSFYTDTERQTSHQGPGSIKSYVTETYTTLSFYLRLYKLQTSFPLEIKKKKFYLKASCADRTTDYQVSSLIRRLRALKPSNGQVFPIKL